MSKQKTLTSIRKGLPNNSLTTLVASYLPPRPTSMIATSTCKKELGIVILAPINDDEHIQNLLKCRQMIRIQRIVPTRLNSFFLQKNKFN